MPKSRNKRTKKKHSVSKASRERQRKNKFRKEAAKNAEIQRMQMNRIARNMGMGDVF